jgi:hypothetical protein
MVLASNPVASANRCAARPVGAASPTSAPISCKGNRPRDQEVSEDLIQLLYASPSYMIRMTG